MQRLRRTWLALIAGVFLVTLSVSAALGAAPAGTRDATRGQTIAAFVHQLNFGSDETEEPNEEPVEEEELIDEELDEEPIEDEELEEELDEDQSDAHGACVSAAAQDRDGSAESQLKNHGKWVSQHARYTCWGLDVPTDETDEEATDEDETSEVDATSAETVDDGPKASKADNADKADRSNGKPSWAGNGNGGQGKPAAAGNNGNGRGGGGRR